MREGSGSIGSHRDLIVWQKAMRLVVESYRIARKLPREGKFELGMQIRTAATSIPRNIAEGKGRRGAAEYTQFLSVARGSTRELDTSLELTIQLDFVPRKDVAPTLALGDEIARMLTAMMNRLNPL